MKKPTIKDIASMCGVSVSTVSRAINNGDEISSETRHKILDVIKETGYSPNQNARNLKISKNKTIAVLIKGITNPFFTPMLKVLEEEITKLGYSFSLHKVEENLSEVDLATRLVKNLKPEGVIFLGGYFANDSKELEGLNIPFSMTTIINKDLDIERSTCVGIDDFHEAKKIVDYLISLGHRQIAMIGPRYNDLSIGKLRIDGYRAALEDAGIKFDERMIIHPPAGLNPYSLHHGYESMKKIINDNIECTAIFSISDLVAMGAIKALDDMNMSVPEDYSVVGFDGLELNEFLVKPITTIVQPTVKIAYKSVKELFNIIKNKEYEKVTRYDGELFIGKTTSPYTRS